MDDKNFQKVYKKLNVNQKLAVDTIDGPVMVVAGPGTGKTDVLTMRIANILNKTDGGAESILCLTFTNSGVRAMRARLESYIGKSASDVRVSTFHSFAIELVEKHYELLDFTKVPELLTDEQAVFLVDEILHNNEWEYIRPRTNPTMYFGELKGLISLLKREGISEDDFLIQVESDIKSLESDPDSISSRGESKGKLKKEVDKKIESLMRTKEVVEFYRIYEKRKKENSMMDYDDVLTYAVKICEDFEDVRADIYENYHYVLVDEHQDSSGVQNSFLKAVWKDMEAPNIFVVGDDRQLIYGFSGANIDYFTEFKTCFGNAKLITLTENYRSTEPILTLADDLLSSSITKEKLNSNKKGDAKVALSEYSYPRDEILGAGLYFKEKIAQGINSEECAILVPKNYHVRQAMQILKDMGIPVSSGKSISLWSATQSESLYRILNIISDPYNSILLSESLLDSTSSVKSLEAHKFLKNTKADKLTIDEIIASGESVGSDLGSHGGGLFAGENAISKWGSQLKDWVDKLSNEKLTQIVSTVGNELLINKSKDHDELLQNVEVVRSFIHLAMQFEEKNFSRVSMDTTRHDSAESKLKDFLEYITRLQSYGSHIELATFGGIKGVQVMTLHKSKGLQYKCVWIAHMNEETLMSEKKGGFTLPEKVKEHMHIRDVESAKRELYVAITRAEEFCTISYANESLNGTGLELAEIINKLDDVHFVKKNKEETEKEILEVGPKVYTEIVVQENGNVLDDLAQFVKENFKDTKVTVTMLNNFFECPWKWYFRNFLKLPEVKGASLALGSAVHSTIEFILKAGKLPKDVDIKVEIKKQLLKEGMDDKGTEIKKLFKDAEIAVMNWVENYYKDLAKDYTSERSVQFRDAEFPEFLMYGKLDLTERFPNGDIIITDFKTGSVRTSGVIEKLEEGKLSTYMRQLAMYSYLVAGAEKGKVVSESRLLFLEADNKDKNKLYSTHIGLEQIDLLKSDIKDYNEALKTGSWTVNECHYKPFGASHSECPYCKLSKRIFAI